MAKVAATEFSKAVVGVCSESKAVRTWDVKIFEDSVARIRIFLVDSSFIDVYYNAETKKVSFAWIINNKRAYGTDNLGGWHIHPVGRPDIHSASAEVDFREFLTNIEQKIGASSRDRNKNPPGDN